MKFYKYIFLFISFITFVCNLEEKAKNMNKIESTYKNKNLNRNSNSIKNSNSNSNNNVLSNQNSNKFVTSDKIFISEKILKSKKSRQINISVNPTAQVKSNTINDVIKSSDNLVKNSNILEVALSDDENLSDLKIGKGPIFLQKWLKFFKYSDSELNKETPNKFFRNSEFLNQQKYFPNANLTLKTEDLYEYIPGEAYFLGVLFRSSLNFLTSRQTQMQKTFETLNIDMIRQVMEAPGFKSGGIVDFGNFSEGYCFKIMTTKENWVLCLETQEDKSIMMLWLKKLKLKMQRDNGIVPLEQSKKETFNDVLNPEDKSGSQKLIKDAKGNLGVAFNSDQKITDGYWIVLQSWTQCSLKCGGGTSFLHRMCVPPKEGGANCQGEAVMTKKCNTQPCPNVLKTSQKNSTNTVRLKPIIKVMPFSSRPQRYTKCIIKESDLMMTKDPQSNENNNNPELDANLPTDMQNFQIPTRVVMNNKTISIFAGDDYQTLITTFYLSKTQFLRDKKKEACFILSENSENKEKRVQLCPFGCDNVDKALDEWDEHFHLFKINCQTSPDVINLDSEFKKKFEDKIKKAKKELLEEQEKEIKKRLAEKEKVKMEEVIKTTNQVALQAIQKEMNLEEMIKNEEAEREARMETEMRERIEKEKIKEECIHKAIKEKKIESQYNLKAQQAEEEIKKIKQSTAYEVQVRRSQLKDLILKMRKQAERKQEELEAELRNARLAIASEMGKAYRKGEAQKCVNATKCKETRNNYCIANFKEDFLNLKKCRDGDDFCTLCCNTEFGDFFDVEKQNCYNISCKVDPDQNDSNDTNARKGIWIWHNNID